MTPSKKPKAISASDRKSQPSKSTATKTTKAIKNPKPAKAAKVTKATKATKDKTVKETKAKATKAATVKPAKNTKAAKAIKDVKPKVTKSTKTTKSVVKKEISQGQGLQKSPSEKPKVKTVKVTKLSKVKIKIPKPVKTSAEKIQTSVPPSPVGSDTDILNKVKLTRAITDNLIPIAIPPLKITLAKQPTIKKEDDGNQIVMSTDIQVPLNRAWEFWTAAHHIKHWFIACEGWVTADVQNDFTPNGKINVLMTSEDGRESSDFQAEYVEIIPKTMIVYFSKGKYDIVVTMNQTSSEILRLTVCFEPEEEDSVALQKLAWDNILKNFKSYAEKN